MKKIVLHTLFITSILTTSTTHTTHKSCVLDQEAFSAHNEFRKVNLALALMHVIKHDNLTKINNYLAQKMSTKSKKWLPLCNDDKINITYKIDCDGVTPLPYLKVTWHYSNRTAKLKDEEIFIKIFALCNLTTKLWELVEKNLDELKQALVTDDYSLQEQAYFNMLLNVYLCNKDYEPVTEKEIVQAKTVFEINKQKEIQEKNKLWESQVFDYLTKLIEQTKN